MNTDGFSLKDFLGTITTAYGDYTTQQAANTAQAGIGNQAAIQQQIALLNAQSQAASNATTKQVLLYGLIAVAVIAVVYLFKKR